jgi:microcystin-dependent protein
LNAIQDAAAGLSDFTQTIDLATVRIGDGTIQLLKYGASEARLSAALRADGIVRGLGGIVPGQFTTAQRDAIPAGSRPYGLVIVNSSTNRLEINLGTDAVPVWSTNLAGAVIAIQDEGSTMPSRNTLNFQGSGVTVTDNPASGRLDITIPGVSGGGGGGGGAVDPQVGLISAWPGSSEPVNYMICNGRSLSTTTYAALFNVLGYAFGGSGSSFNIPDIQGRMIVGVGAHVHHNALNKNDGLANAQRAASHHHLYDRPINPAHIGPSASDPSDIQVNAKTSGDTNNQDRPAFITLNWIIRVYPAVHTP